VAIRDAVQALGIEVRAGLRTDECEVRGDDIGGIAVYIAARVSALAGANDVLVSRTLRDLVIGSGLEFEDRDAHQLKGVPGEWHLFPVASPQPWVSAKLIFACRKPLVHPVLSA
jgi:class 3 adenylate cyclase